MNNTMEYTGYIGSVEFSAEDVLFYGKVMGIRALISYEGENARDLLSDFHGAVDDYLALCAIRRKEPEKAYKGNFKCAYLSGAAAVITAAARHSSLNSFVEGSIEQAIASGN